MRSHLTLLMGLTLILSLGGCSDDCTGPEDIDAGLLEYSGDFECDDLDGDTAVLWYDADSETGWFGWVPSNGGTGTYVMAAIDGLTFTVTFRDVYGADKSGETETLVFSFSGALSSDESTITGTGTVVRESGATEDCSFTFSRN